MPFTHNQYSFDGDNNNIIISVKIVDGVIVTNAMSNGSGNKQFELLL